MVPNQEDKVDISDQASERAVLACLMQVPVKIVDCVVKLKKEDFTNPYNQYLYGIMVFIYEKSQGKSYSFDISTLMSRAKANGKEIDFVEKSGGEGYLEHLQIITNSINMVNVTMFDAYVKAVKDCSIKRELSSRLEDIKKKIADDKNNADELIIYGQSYINDLLTVSSARETLFSNLGHKSASIVEDAALAVKKDLIGLKTLYRTLDATIEGLKRKNLIIISAPRKTGKSAFLMNIGLNVGVLQNIPTLMISTEMSDQEILYRSLSRLAGVKEKDIIKGNLNTGDTQRLFEAQAKFYKGNFHHTYMLGYSVDKIISTVRKFVNEVVKFNEKGESKDCLVIFDYIKLPREGVSFGAEQKEYKVLGQIADTLKELAGSLDIPILTACQTNRSGGTANSFELEWYCNTFMELKNKTDKELERFPVGNQLLKIPLNRGGDENYDGISFQYNKPILSYEEIKNG